MSNTTIRFGAAFFCEDVRVEDNGKVMFLGTYTGTLGSTVNPGSTYLHLVLIFRSSQADTAHIKLSVHMGDTRVADADYELIADAEGNTFSIFPILAFEDVESSQPLFINLSIDDLPAERVHIGVFEVPEAGVAEPD